MRKRPIILLGCKSDTRGRTEEPEEKHVSYEDGTAFAKEIGALLYLECSAKLGTGFDELSNAIAKTCIIVDPQNKQNSKKTMRNYFGLKKR